MSGISAHKRLEAEEVIQRCTEAHKQVTRAYCDGNCPRWIATLAQMRLCNLRHNLQNCLDGKESAELVGLYINFAKGDLEDFERAISEFKVKKEGA